MVTLTQDKFFEVELDTRCEHETLRFETAPDKATLLAALNTLILACEPDDDDRSDEWDRDLMRHNQEGYEKLREMVNASAWPTDGLQLSHIHRVSVAGTEIGSIKITSHDIFKNRYFYGV